MSEGIKIITKNRRASHDYHLLEMFEAGLVLQGTEIKSIRGNKVTLQRSYVEVRDGEMWLMGANIAPYELGNRENHEPTRPRKLLLHRREINKIRQALAEKGLTLVPTKMYFKRGRAKVEIALARGKKQYDKRQDLARRDSQRRIERALSDRY
ncbi:MAG TPA: SsrA-binding protein SmpB [Anaerolineae bacterium]|nr:SsrA-binding protein SmpB [Anaerolineae bacterium]